MRVRGVAGALAFKVRWWRGNRSFPLDIEAGVDISSSSSSLPLHTSFVCLDWFVLI